MLKGHIVKTCLIKASLLVMGIVFLAPPTATAELELFPRPIYKSADGKLELRARGRLIEDIVKGTDSDGQMDLSESETRAGRIGFEGSYGQKFSFRAEAQLLDNEVNFTVVDITFKGPVDVTVGFTKMGAPMAEATSSKNINFMERGHFTDAFDYSRGMGVMLGKSGDTWHVEAGVAKGDLNDTFSAAPLLVAGRASYAFDLNGVTLHVGANARRRKADGSGADFGYAQRAHQHLAFKFIDTNSISNKDTTLGGELALIAGPFSLDAEYSVLKADLSNPDVGDVNPTFSGGYAAASFFLTGAGRNYRPSRGTFGAPKLDSPIDKGGLGAVEAVARFDRVDLSDQAIRGGEQDSYTFGMNWYLHQYIRIMFNYTHARIKNANLVLTNGDDGANTVNVAGVRLQLAW